MNTTEHPEDAGPRHCLGELQRTRAECGARLWRLSWAATEGCLRRLFRLGVFCSGQGVEHWRRVAGEGRPEKLLTAPARIAAECGDALYAETQNMNQIVRFTQSELVYWYDRLARDWMCAWGGMLGLPPRR